MKGMKDKFLNLLAKAGMKSAINAAGSASSLCFHQPKEPKSLKKMLKK